MAPRAQASRRPLLAVIGGSIAVCVLAILLLATAEWLGCEAMVIDRYTVACHVPGSTGDVVTAGPATLRDCHCYTLASSIWHRLKSVAALAQRII